MKTRGIIINACLWIAFLILFSMFYSAFTADFISPATGSGFFPALFALAIAYVSTFGAAIHYAKPVRSRFFGFLLFF